MNNKNKKNPTASILFTCFYIFLFMEQCSKVRDKPLVAPPSWTALPPAPAGVATLPPGHISIHSTESCRQLPRGPVAVLRLPGPRALTAHTLSFPVGENWPSLLWEELTLSPGTIAMSYSRVANSTLVHPNTSFLAISPKAQDSHTGLGANRVSGFVLLSKRIIQSANLCIASKHS